MSSWDKAAVGDVLMLGGWQGELLFWKVVAVENNKMMLMSLYALASMKFNEEKGSVTWSNCSLRRYLNGSFLEQAFSLADRECILESEIDCTDMEKDREGIPALVVDKVFILSVSELLALGLMSEDLTCKPLTKKYGRACEWWLRTKGRNRQFVAVVNERGNINEDGKMACAVPKVNVRPVMWVRR